MSQLNTISEIKKELRREVLNRREHISNEKRIEACEYVTDRVLRHPLYQQAEVLLGFAGYGSEIDTDKILEDALEKEKRVFLPRVLGDTMEFFRVYQLNSLKIGYKGIREPEITEEVFCYHKEPEGKILMLMPGVAFDSMHHRMGYGKGFYDRYLSRYEGLQKATIALGYACQMVKSVPVDEFDICPAEIILGG